MRNFEPFEGLESGEVGFVVELLAAMCTMPEIKTRFFDFSGKVISEKLIKKIQLRHGKLIKEQMDLYLANIEGNPLAHLRIRLDLLYRIVQDCLVQRPDKSIRTGAEDFEVVTKAENAVAINAIKLAGQDIQAMEELKMMREEKGFNNDQDFPEADTGMTG